MNHEPMLYPIKAPGYEGGIDLRDTLPFPVLRSEHCAGGFPDAHGLEGDVQYVPLFTVLQVLASTRKAATLLFPLAPKQTAPSLLASLGAWAGVAVYNGFLLDARIGEHTGMEALLRLLLIRNGHFETWFDAILWPVRDTSGQALESSILRASVALDQILAKLEPIPDLDYPLHPRDATMAVTPRAFLLDWPGPMAEGVAVLHEAVIAGSLLGFDPAAPST